MIHGNPFKWFTQKTVTIHLFNTSTIRSAVSKLRDLTRFGHSLKLRKVVFLDVYDLVQVRN